MKIGVIGAGSWGTALAALLAEGQDKTLLWAFEPEVSVSINKNHQNPTYLAQEALPKDLQASSDLKEVVAGAEVLVNAVPSHLTRQVWEKIAPIVGPNALIVNASKGFEFATGKRLSQVLMECLSRHPAGRFVTLSGPSHTVQNH